jgi:hypothetical protein
VIASDHICSGRPPMRRDSFERFYYEKVGLGEGCGCAEHVTRVHDLDALGRRLTSGRSEPGMLSLAMSWLRRAFLSRRTSDRQD